MEHDLENEIRALAHQIWRTAGSEFGQTALDFWVMAEQMVVELTADSVRRANAAAVVVAQNAAAWPSALRALYFYRVRELAHNMWATSAEQNERALDCWLAAEKHLRMLAESAASVNADRQEALANVLERFSPAAYLERIRETAQQLWQATGNHYGSALDVWLAAERKILDSLTAPEKREKEPEKG